MYSELRSYQQERSYENPISIKVEDEQISEVDVRTNFTTNDRETLVSDCLILNKFNNKFKANRNSNFSLLDHQLILENDGHSDEQLSPVVVIEQPIKQLENLLKSMNIHHN